jgi:hypothetical protein
MLREFTRDVGRRFKAGEMHDYPRNVWNRIVIDAKTALKATEKDFSLDSFTKAVGHNPALQSMLKGRDAVQHKRLGT